MAQPGSGSDQAFHLESGFWFGQKRKKPRKGGSSVDQGSELADFDGPFQVRPPLAVPRGIEPLFPE